MGGKIFLKATYGSLVGTDVLWMFRFTGEVIYLILKRYLEISEE